MKKVRWISGRAIAIFLASVATAASANNYERILVGNVFHLVPPPPPPTERIITTPPPKLLLTGITTFFRKRALLKTTASPKPGQLAVEESYILAEGEQDGDIGVITIDEKAAVVTVNNHGTVQVLNIANDAPKLIPSSAVIQPVVTSQLVTASSEPQVKPLTPEEQIILIEAQRTAMIQRGDDAARILPPTGM